MQGTAMTSSLLSHPGCCHYAHQGEQNCVQAGTTTLACHHISKLAGPCPAGRGFLSSHRQHWMLHPQLWMMGVP